MRALAVAFRVRIGPANWVQRMTPDPNRKPSKAEARIGGMVALAVLVFIGLLTVAFVMMG